MPILHSKVNEVAEDPNTDEVGPTDWNDPHVGGIEAALLTAKGDIIAASAADTPARVAVGSNGSLLQADSTWGTGVSWLKCIRTTTDPTVTDDVAAGYAVGSRWVNTVLKKEFVCLDATTGAAYWVLTTGGQTGFEIPFGNGSDVIVAGENYEIEYPYLISGTIKRVVMFGGPTGSLVVDIWKADYSTYPPVVGDSITSSTPPTISAGVKSYDATLTGWDRALAYGDILRFTVISASGLTRATLSMAVTVP